VFLAAGWIGGIIAIFAPHAIWTYRREGYGRKVTQLAAPRGGLRARPRESAARRGTRP
jgi:hypothetical protein